jgi:hypothetical protein
MIHIFPFTYIIVTKIMIYYLLFLALTTTCMAAASSINEGPVCATEKGGNDNDTQTFISYEAAKSRNATVMHCGNCGECSNTHDIDFYNDTRNTLTNTTRQCAFGSMLSGLRSARARRCLNATMGCTHGCLDCWADNIACAKKKCTFTCFKYYVFGFGDFVGTLDPCLACDEEKCGPDFAACAGANRRRAGIQSDIARPDEEVCTLVGL